MRDDEIFYRFTPFIQDYIYQNGWKGTSERCRSPRLRRYSRRTGICCSHPPPRQAKTEAAFFPIISLMCEDMPKSVGALYIAPLQEPDKRPVPAGSTSCST